MGRGILTGLAVLALSLVAGSLALTSVTQDVLNADYNGTVIYDQRYGEAERNLYDLYLPEDCSADRAQHLILFIHGGAWSGGDKADGQQGFENSLHFLLLERVLRLFDAIAFKDTLTS